MQQMNRQQYCTYYAHRPSASQLKFLDLSVAFQVVRFW
jgi:hypothetical protein